MAMPEEKIKEFEKILGSDLNEIHVFWSPLTNSEYVTGCPVTYVFSVAAEDVRDGIDAIIDSIPEEANTIVLVIGNLYNNPKTYSRPPKMLH